MGAKIAHAFKNNNISKLHAANRLYYSSYACISVACAEAAKRNKGVNPSELAETLNVWGKCDEKAVLDPQPKPNGEDYRYIVKCGPENQARQLLIKNSLLHRFEIHPNQYVFNGGRDKAIQVLARNYRQGYTHVNEIDVYQCFRSFDIIGVSKFLLLPKEVCRNVLSGANLNISLSRRYERITDYNQSTSGGLTALQEFEYLESDWSPAREGLIEGSLVSPLACELLLSWVAEQLPEQLGKLVNYADNFFLMCKSDDDAKELHIILRKLLEQHPAGPLKVKNNYNAIKPNAPFEFLGYWFEPANGDLNIKWCENAYKKAKMQRARVYDLLRSKLSPKKKAYAVNQLFDEQQSLIAGYKEWTGGKFYLRKKMRKLVHEAEANGVPPQLLKANLIKFIS